MSVQPIAGRIADYGAELDFKDIPADAVHEAKRRIMDSFGCMLGGYFSPPAKAARAVAPRVQEKNSSYIILSDFPTLPDYAAFANGIMVRYLDYNDTYLSKEPAHPSDNIPAALAAAEAAGRTGADLITAVAAAYEVQCRLCDAASLRARGWDHVTYGSFSSTLAASMLLGLSKEQTVNALGIAGAASPALRQTRAGELSMWKGCAFANTARNAVFTAIIAKNGITGPAQVFEGEFGFENIVSGPIRLAGFARGAQDTFKIVETYIKYYPAEYHSQSAIGAAIELSKEIEDTDSIESVTVRTFGAAYEIIGSGREKWRPGTRETADHSLPFCTASALMDGAVTLETFSDERIKNQKLLGLVDRVRIVKDMELDRLYPESMPNRVEVTLRSGRFLSREMIYPKGHPKNPLTDMEVEEKFKRLGQWYFDDKKLGSVISAIWSLDELEDIRDLLKLFKRGR